MKSIFTLLLFISLSLESFGQSTPYIEFTEFNDTELEQTLIIPAGGFVWMITDNSNPLDIKTYVRSSRVTSVDVTPVTPANWNAFKMYYDVETPLRLPVSGSTDYVLDNNFSPYVKIN